jgi:hypothetical protein
MLNAPPGRLRALRTAGRPDPHGTWQYRHHAIDEIRRMPPAIDKM